MNPVWKRSFGSLPNDTNLSPTMFSPRDPSRVLAAEANGTAYSLKPSTPIFSPRAIISPDPNATSYSLKSISPTFSPQAVLTADSNATAYSLKSVTPDYSLTNGVSPAPDTDTAVDVNDNAEHSQTTTALDEIL
ncbi:unnamed protein product [Anisakis simplex]|uniref:Uncharacterized protein n=1 Tax=Anisakis simplex TaxID=6269 RepID=A0A0M3J0W7_ANISI|nr:unnamed protein product [Anisakis simplex]